VVVVLPSPAGVGLMAVTRMRWELGRSGSESSQALETFAL